MPGILTGRSAAAATTGPANGPLPASSTPITIRRSFSKLFWRDFSLVRGRQAGSAASSLSSFFFGPFFLEAAAFVVEVVVASAFFTLVDLRFLRPSVLVLVLVASVLSELISAALRLGLPLVLRTVDLDVDDEEALISSLLLLVDRLIPDVLSRGDLRLGLTAAAGITMAVSAPCPPSSFCALLLVNLPPMMVL